MGYAFSDFFEMFYTSKVSWFSMNNVSGGSVTIANGLSALGATCYFKPEAPSFFVAGGLGVSTWSTPFESGAESLIGFGLFAEAGYEFSKHMNVELDLMLGQPSKTKNEIETRYDALTVKLTVNVLGY